MKAVSNFVFLSLAVLVLTGFASAGDSSALKPPPGAKVAVVMFEDMECPSCAANFPKVEEAGQAHHVPVLLRDFPLGPSHPWSLEAAIWARFFDTKSEDLGLAFRTFIFKNQPQITPGNLRQYVQKFADDNHVPVPFVNDPEGKLKEKVMADRELGLHLGVHETPTIYVVSNNETQPVKPDNLSQVIEDMQKKAGPTAPAKNPVAKSVKKKAS